jgi:hypothetical protein
MLPPRIAYPHPFPATAQQLHDDGPTLGIPRTDAGKKIKSRKCHIPADILGLTLAILTTRGQGPRMRLSR